MKTIWTCCGRRVPRSSSSVRCAMSSCRRGPRASSSAAASRRSTPRSWRRNRAMHAALRAAHRQGLPIYAECGGLMYLTRAIIDGDGRAHEMVGLLPGRSIMGGRLTLGYRLARAAGDSWLLPGRRDGARARVPLLHLGGPPRRPAAGVDAAAAHGGRPSHGRKAPAWAACGRRMSTSISRRGRDWPSASSQPHRPLSREVGHDLLTSGAPGGPRSPRNHPARHSLAALAAALQFLTVMPPLVRRPFTPEELGGSVGWFPARRPPSRSHARRNRLAARLGRSPPA